MPVSEYLNTIKKINASNESNLNNIFDQINLLSTVDICRESEVVGDLLLHLMNLVPNTNDHILSKFCSLVCYFLKNSITLQTSENLFEFLISKLSCCGTWVLSDVLVASYCLLSNTSFLKLDLVNNVLKEESVLFSQFAFHSHDKSIKYNALRCLFALLKNHGSLLSKKWSFCYLKCLSLLKEPSKEDTKVDAKILVCCLKCLQLVFSYDIAVITNTGEILGILKSLSFYGFPGQTSLHNLDLVPTLSLPESTYQESLSESSDAPYSTHRKQKKNRRRLKKSHHKVSNHFNKEEDEENLNGPSLASFKDNKIKNSSSDSEFSDIDSQTSGMRALQASVRQNAYQTLHIFVKLIDQKTMFSYWTAFLPDHPVTSSVNQTLFYSVLKDTSAQVRLSALTILSEMMRGSKQYLILADGRSTRHSAFTSLSSILASMIIETHRCLLLALIAEKSPVLLLQILKCYAALAENVPYNKLSTEVLFKYLKHIKGLFYHKDVQVQVASLSVFTCIVNSNQTPEELESIILSPEDSNDWNQLPWIVDVCRQKIYNDNHVTVRIEALQLLSSVTGKYFKKSNSFSYAVKEVIFFCLNDSEHSLQYHGVKLLNVIGRCANVVPSSGETANTVVSEIFLSAVSKPLIKCLTNEEQKSLQAAVCDCLSTLPAEDFASLDSKQQILYVSILLGLASDSNANVRGSAIRCLGIFCLFPSLVEDASFYDDLSRILVSAVNDTNVNVRFKASWALGNLSDAVFLKRDSVKEIDVQLFHSVGMACIGYSKDSERVKANAVRALGNFLLFTPQQYLSSLLIIDFIGKACETLLYALSANFMKVCWNACYALKSMMKNDNLLELPVVNKETILKALISVLNKSPNFKVRISCVQAATSLKCRNHYGTVFPLLWKQILRSLESASKDANFKEMKHKENLSQQLCLSFCHLVSLVTLQDLDALEEDTKEMLLTSMWKFGLTKEKSATLSAALSNIEVLIKASEKKPVILTTLEDVLNQAILANSQLEDIAVF